MNGIELMSKGMHRGARVGGRPVKESPSVDTEPGVTAAYLERITGLHWVGPIDGRWSAAIPGGKREIAVIWKDWGSLGWIVIIRKGGMIRGKRHYGADPEAALREAGL